MGIFLYFDKEVKTKQGGGQLLTEHSKAKGAEENESGGEGGTLNPPINPVCPPCKARLVLFLCCFCEL